MQDKRLGFGQFPAIEIRERGALDHLLAQSTIRVGRNLHEESKRLQHPESLGLDQSVG
jgi:hypothetical protein